MDKFTFSEIVQSRPARMKRRYKTALQLPLKPGHWTVRMFVKFEKMHDPDKACRAIQYRATPFTARLARFLLPLEHKLYDIMLPDNHNYRVFAKGRNARDRALDLRRAFDHYDRPYVYLVDHSKFDSSVNAEHIKACHKVYCAINKSRELKFLLDKQIKNNGSTRNGIKYTCIARRMSGDADTALGNSLINYFVLRYVFGDEAIIYLDGDDSVVFLPRACLTMSRLAETGFESKWECVRSFEMIEFCQSKPSYVDGWVMLREPIRALSRSVWKCGKRSSDHADYIHTVGVGESWCSDGSPLMWTLANEYIRRTPAGKVRMSYLEYGVKIRAFAKYSGEPTIVSRAITAEQADMPGDLQLEYEKRIRGMVLFN